MPAALCCIVLCVVNCFLKNLLAAGQFRTITEDDAGSSNCPGTAMQNAEMAAERTWVVPFANVHIGLCADAGCDSRTDAGQYIFRRCGSPTS